MMGDNLKLSKDKRNRSTSSIAGVVLEGTLSERKLNMKASIPEVDDHFVIAEARCEDLQEKIDLIKILKKKRKLKKGSTTRVTDQQLPVENVPIISVQTQPKKSTRRQGVQLTTPKDTVAASCVEVSVTEDYSDYGRYELKQPRKNKNQNKNKNFSEGQRSRLQGMVGQRRIVKTSSNEEEEGQDMLPVGRPQKTTPFNKIHKRANNKAQNLPRPVVELFNKNRERSSSDSWKGNASSKAASGYCGKAKVRDTVTCDGTTEPLEDSKRMAEVPRSARRIRYRTVRRYEMPTIASRMKQTGARLYIANTNSTNIPFVISNSTTPSHNIGVNIQQVLNVLKSQQPLSGIPLTLAHHMGLSHISTDEMKSVQEAPNSECQNMNAIWLGKRLLKLQSYKSMSYSRLLELYREGDGMVPKFLQGLNRPHYFSNSMYNLATNYEDIDGATSKGQPSKQAAKQRLTEYARIYKEYEHLEKILLSGGFKPELFRRHKDLQRKLLLKEQQIRKLLQGFGDGGGTGPSTHQAPPSVAEEGYRQSTYKLNAGDAPQC